MKVKLKPEIEKKIEELIAELKGLGLYVEERPELWIHSEGIQEIGKRFPTIVQTCTGRINFIVPDNLVQTEYW